MGEWRSRPFPPEAPAGGGAVSLLDILKPAPVVTAATPGRVHRMSNRPPERRVHHIAAPDEDLDLQLADALPPRPVSFPTVAPDVPINRAGEGETMPTGHYDRSKAKKRAKKGEGGAVAAPGAAPVAGDKATRKKRKARAGAAPMKAGRSPRQGEPRFAVFTDGSVLIEAPGCTGTLSAEHAKVLVNFINRLKGE